MTSPICVLISLNSNYNYCKARKGYRDPALNELIKTDMRERPLWVGSSRSRLLYLCPLD